MMVHNIGWQPEIDHSILTDLQTMILALFFLIFITCLNADNVLDFRDIEDMKVRDNFDKYPLVSRVERKSNICEVNRLSCSQNKNLGYI